MKLDVDLTPQEAEAFAQFLKRASLSDYRSCAQDDQEAWAMQSAGEKIRKAFTEAGYSPR